MWHLIFLAFFIFSIIRFIIYMRDRRPYRYVSNPVVRTYTMTHRRANHDLIDLSGEIHGETERAWRFYDGKETAWLPKSLCEWDEESKTMTVPEWMAIEKGLV